MKHQDGGARELLLLGMFAAALVMACPITPTPGPTPSPTPTPTPTPVACPCNIPASDAAGWTHDIPVESVWGLELVKTARDTVGVCSGQQTPDIKRFAAVLVTNGVCAAQWDDAILLQRPDDFNGHPIYEQWHVWSAATKCWSLGLEGKYIGTWSNSNVVSCPKGSGSGTLGPTR